MNAQIEERIKIVKQFNSVYSTQEKNPGKANFWFRMSAGFDYWGVMLLLAFLIFVSFSAIFQIEPVNEKWQNSGLLVLMAFALAIKSPYSFIELVFLKHIKRLSGLDLSFPDSLNHELKEIITRLNSKKHRLNIVGLPSILIMLGGTLKVLELNPYWNYFSYFVLVFSTILLIRIQHLIHVVKRNINELETITKL